MEITITHYKGIEIATISPDDIVINDAGDSLHLLANCYYQGASAIILRKEQIVPSFFDLKTGLAGEVLQKYSNYKMKLAIVGDFSAVGSKSLRDFIYESNKMGHINFAGSIEEAKEKLSKV